MPQFPTPEWFEVMINVLDQNEEYKRVGAEWEGDMILAIEAEEGMLPESFYYYQKPHKGDMLENHEIKSLDEKPDCAFILSGPYSVWKSIISGQGDAMQLMMQGKIKVKGNMQQLLRYAKFQQLGLNALKEVETTFVDD